MPTRVSSNGSGLLFLWIIFAAFTAWQTLSMKIEEDKFSAPFILIPLLLIYTLDILKMRVLSYDNEFVYLKGVIKEQQLDYSAIIKAKRVLFRSYDISELNFGYKLVYMNENGKKRSCHFYIPHTKTDLWERFKGKMVECNPSIEIHE